MTDETKVNGEEIKNEAVNEEKVDAPEADAKEVSEDAKEDKTKKKKNKKQDAEIAALEEKLKESEDRYLRILAEYDNFRKRSAKEKEGIYSDAYADALKNIIPMIDNLERAVGIEGAEAVAKGLEMTLKGASEALSKMGVEAFGASGDAFDPNMHSAMMMVDDENHKEGEIVTVFQKGYRKGDKIIRYAMVTVAN
jgi:molecular chaperone GrpE